MGFKVLRQATPCSDPLHQCFQLAVRGSRYLLPGRICAVAEVPRTGSSPARPSASLAPFLLIDPAKAHKELQTSARKSSPRCFFSLQRCAPASSSVPCIGLTASSRSVSLRISSHNEGRGEILPMPRILISTDALVFHFGRLWTPLTRATSERQLQDSMLMIASDSRFFTFTWARLVPSSVTLPGSCMWSQQRHFPANCAELTDI